MDALKDYDVSVSKQIAKSLQLLDASISRIREEEKAALNFDEELMVEIEKLLNKKLEKLTGKAPRYRYLEPYCPVTREYDRIFPAVEELSYHKYVVGVLDAETDVQYNFKMSDDSESKINAERALHLKSWIGEIRKIIIWYNAPDAMLFGFEFLNS